MANNEIRINAIVNIALEASQVAQRMCQCRDAGSIPGLGRSLDLAYHLCSKKLNIYTCFLLSPLIVFLLCPLINTLLKVFFFSFCFYLVFVFNVTGFSQMFGDLQHSAPF